MDEAVFENEKALKQEQLTKLAERVERLKQTVLALKEETILEENLETDEELQDPITEAINATDEKDYVLIESPKQKQKNTTAVLEQEAIATVTKNKKHIIKQKIIGVANKNRVTIKQLKEIIVDKQQYCSKATFYRYINELKVKKQLESININNKEFVYGIKKENAF